MKSDSSGKHPSNATAKTRDHSGKGQHTQTSPKTAAPGKSAKPVYPLCGKWDVLSISVELRGRYEKLKAYAGDEYVWDFGPDSVIRITSSSDDQRNVLARYHLNAKTMELHI